MTFFFKLTFYLLYRLLQFLNPDPLRADEISDLQQVLQTLKMKGQTRQTLSVIKLPSSLRLLSSLDGAFPSHGCSGYFIWGEQMIFNLWGDYVFSRKHVFLGFYMMILCFPLGKKPLILYCPLQKDLAMVVWCLCWLVAESEVGHTTAWCGTPEQDRALSDPGEIPSVSRPEEGECIVRARLLKEAQPFWHRRLALFSSVLF